MNIFKILANGILKKNYTSGLIESIDLSSPVVELKREVQASFESDEIVDISDNGYIDTTDPLNIQIYLNNVRLLASEVRKNGNVDKFAIIREDDHFPYDWKWRVPSSSTSAEYGKCNLTYAIRMAKAEEMVNPNRGKSVINIPGDEKKIYEAASTIDEKFGRVFMPSHFRSTKHFTINTPLGYTGSYNSGISADRKFIIIDDISEFIKSGYGYSADYMDAYLDVTHEELPISDKAVVLISEDDYEEVIRDSRVREQLSERRVIRYSGDESLAVNMVLSGDGILPFRAGGVYGYYDDNMQMILENSMRELCSSNDLLYAQGHGNINGVGGHFSDLFDSMYGDDASFSVRLANYLRNYFPEYAEKINDDILNRPGDIAEVIGPDKLNGAILLFNDIEKKRVESLRIKYDRERDMLTDDERQLFRETVSLLNKFYSDSNARSEDSEIRDVVREFYHSSEIESQLSAAKIVRDYIRKKLGLDGDFVL